MMQRMDASGSTRLRPQVGDLQVSHFYPESSKDRWTTGLTVEGKIGNFDLVYAFSNLNRDVDSESDYNDYAFWYDTLASYGAYFYDDSGDLINPSQYIQAFDGYDKRSHELRITSPEEQRFRFVGGLFWQQQSHEIFQRYGWNDLAASISVSGFEDHDRRPRRERRDRDEAISANCLSTSPTSSP